MSDDLISRKDLEKAIRAYADDVGCNRGEYELANGILKALSMVEIAPTAYDVDKIAEELERRALIADKVSFGLSCINERHTELKIADTYRQAKLIVKSGGINN